MNPFKKFFLRSEAVLTKHTSNLIPRNTPESVSLCALCWLVFVACEGGCFYPGHMIDAYGSIHVTLIHWSSDMKFRGVRVRVAVGTSVSLLPRPYLSRHVGIMTIVTSVSLLSRPYHDSWHVRILMVEAGCGRVEAGYGRLYNACVVGSGGKRGRWGTPTMTLHIRIQHRE